jgi:hypothetical protein
MPVRWAQAALGHNSKAVHEAYARNAVVVCPPIDQRNTWTDAGMNLHADN